MRRITTAYSVYELDEENKRLRKLTGVNPPTERQVENTGEDGWMTYESVSICGPGEVLGYCLLIQWGWNEDGSARCTATSNIVSDEVLA